MSDRTWWGEWTIPLGTAGRWRIGPLTLTLSHRVGEWRAHQARGTDPLDDALLVEVPCEPDLDVPSSSVTRFALAAPSPVVQVRPSVADRPVVFRPDMPFYLLPDEEVRLYVTTPLWIQVLIGGDRLLLDTPTHRPSDTWLGPNTRVGTLCYAGRSTARLDPAELHIRPGRVATPVVLRNRARDSMLVDRLSLPVRSLPVYADESARLWTSRVTLVRHEAGTLAGLEIDPGPPLEAGTAAPVAGPREPSERNILFRAFSALLG